MSNIIKIDSLSSPELDVYARLTETQLASGHGIEHKLFIAESPKVITRALDAGYVPESILVEERHIKGESAEVLERVGDVPVYTAPFDVLTELTGYKLTRGLLCAMRRPESASVSDIIKGKERVAVLDSVMNPTNVGAIFRSAAALGMDAVILTPGCSDPLYRRAARVSMGTVFQIPWTYADENWISELRREGFKLAAMALDDDSVPIDSRELQLSKRLAVVLGTEGDGLAESTVADCDYTVRIPMSHGVDSLNVAAASAVAFWELRRR